MYFFRFHSLFPVYFFVTCTHKKTLMFLYQQVLIILYIFWAKSKAECLEIAQGNSIYTIAIFNHPYICIYPNQRVV